MPNKIRKFGFDIVHGCQLRCIGCPISTLKPKIHFVEPEVFDKCLSNVDVRKVNKLRLYNYGEPLLHPKLAEVLCVIPKQKFQVNDVEITTNGQVWNEERFREAFSLNIVTQLYVSCDGDSTSDDYEKLRPPAKWEKLIKFMRKMKKLRDEVCLNMFLGTRTICTDRKARRRWKSILSDLGYKPEFRPWGTRADCEQQPWGKRKVPKGACRYVADMRKLKLYADYDGTVVACCVHPRAGVLGNLITQKYSEILKSKTRKAFVKLMARDRYAIPACKDCEEE
jgi:radical SAM protein with 4Fe4S-binding SPASM domain